VRDDIGEVVGSPRLLPNRPGRRLSATHGTAE
jgi:hypothetical protein